MKKSPVKSKVLGKRELHPYGIFMPRNPQAMIIGSFPISKFTDPRKRHTIKKHEVDFSYGGEKNRLWPLLATSFGIELKTKEQILSFLNRKGFAMGDVIRSCRRLDGSANDSDLKEIHFEPDLHTTIVRHGIRTIFFTSTRVQNWFHRKIGKIEGAKEVILMSASASGLRAIPNHLKEEYRKWKIGHPQERTTDFRIYLYRKIFNEKTFPDLK